MYRVQSTPMTKDETCTWWIYKSSSRSTYPVKVKIPLLNLMSLRIALSGNAHNLLEKQRQGISTWISRRRTRDLIILVY